MLILGIIEDLPAVREALHLFLDGQPDMQCGLVSGSVEEFLAGLAAGVAAPAVVLADIGLPGMSGIEGVGPVLARLPGAAVVMLSVHTEAEQVFAALRAGAVGYLDKLTPLPEVAEQLRQVAAGGSPMSPSVARHVVRYFWQRPALAPDLPTLSARELEIVRGIEDGLSYKLIADRLHLSLDTVRSHIRQVYRKLHVSSKAGLLARRRAG